jgi:hypothetical protein
MTGKTNHPITQGSRHAALVCWIARLGAVTERALAEHEDCTSSSARGRLRAAAGAGLVARARPLHGAPSLFTATRAGMTLAGLGGVEPTHVSAASAGHQIACANAAVALERRYPGHVVCGERELQRDERSLGRALASARMSWRSEWGDSHRPDLVLWPAVADGRPVAVEVELTAKAPSRLLEICRAWARCPHVAGVVYLAAPPAFAPVARAIRSAGAEERVALLALEALDRETSPADPVPGTAERRIEG